jgi:tetratricopeptide (TPR) repeat protein
LWLTVIVKLWQVGRSEKGELRSLSAVFGASIFGYLFFNLFDTITFGQKPSIFVWMILAGSIGLTRLVCEPERNTELAAVQSVPRLGKRLVEYSPFILLVILLFSPALPRNLANLRLDKAHLIPTTPLTVTTNDFPGDARRIGLVNYLAGDIDEALKDWRLDPQGGDYLQSQGTIALMAGSPGEAISWYNLALQLEPGSAQTYLWRGSANEGRGTVAMAEADFHKAVELAAVSDLSDSSTAYMYFRLGGVLRRQAEWRPAAEAFFQATRFDPEKPWYFKALGDALTALGDQQGAAAAYEKVDWLTESAG